jgi:hypothetical protein
VAVASLRPLLFSAFRAGGLRGFGLFVSRRSPSGRVLRLSFASWASASAFARRWAVRLGLPVVVRRSVAWGWVVSVPVVAWVPYLPSRCVGSWCLPWCLGGARGLRGFCRAVRRWSAGVV